jgi:hypothetical protein
MAGRETRKVRIVLDITWRMQSLSGILFVVAKVAAFVRSEMGA